MHYAKPAAFAEGRATGVWAPPGRYSVELTAEGQVLRQPLTVLADPRVKVSQADFEAQFRLARQIEQARVRAQTMLHQATELKGGLAKLAGQADAAGLTGEYQALVGPDAPIQGTNAPTTLGGISAWLDKLASGVDGADGAPTPDMLRGFAQISAALNAFEPRWQAFAASARARIPPAR